MTPTRMSLSHYNCGVWVFVMQKRHSWNDQKLVSDHSYSIKKSTHQCDDLMLYAQITAWVLQSLHIMNNLFSSVTTQKPIRLYLTHYSRCVYRIRNICQYPINHPLTLFWSMKSHKIQPSQGNIRKCDWYVMTTDMVILCVLWYLCCVGNVECDCYR